jgi:ribosomal protein L31E
VEETQRAGLEMPSSLDELPEHARRIFASWDEREAVVRALVIVRLASGLEDSSRERRTAALLEAVREFAPHRSKADQLRVAHAIRALLNTTTWHQMRSDFGISGAEAGEAVAHTIRLLIDDLRGAPAKSAGAASG